MALPTASKLAALLQSPQPSANPFATEFGFFTGRGDPNPMRMRIFFPHATAPLKPLLIEVRRDATVEEVIGYTLYEYYNADVDPPLPEELCDVICWSLRIVEDDGSLDEDFP
ncbi:hypothetical protein HK405_015076, partial [Cladochytrium tenue]